MKTAFKLAAASLAFAAGNGAAEVASTKERTYVVRYEDQSIERYAVRWTLDVVSKVRELGSSYVPYQGASQNSRCAWTVTSEIDRSVSLATRLGPTIPLAKMDRKLGGTEPLKGEQEGGCGGPAPQRVAAMERARKAALESFERITEADLEELRAAARTKGEVTAVTVQ